MGQIINFLSSLTLYLPLVNTLDVKLILIKLKRSGLVLKKDAKISLILIGVSHGKHLNLNVLESIFLEIIKRDLKESNKP